MKLLETLHENIKICQNCSLYKTAHKAVPGEGLANAQIMLVGQNPGQEEDKSGRPFIGRSGQYLDRVLEKFKLDRQKLFITSLVKHVSPKNRKPTQEEIQVCLPWLESQIEMIKPKIVVLMGKVAWATPQKEGIHYIKTYHPAAAMRFPKIREVFEKDFEPLKKIFD